MQRPIKGRPAAPGYKRLLVDLPEELHRSLKIRAASDQTTVAEIIRQLVADHLGSENSWKTRP